MLERTWQLTKEIVCIWQEFDSILIWFVGRVSFRVEAAEGKRGVYAIVKEPTPDIAMLERVRVKLMPVAGVSGESAEASKVDWATLLLIESVV